MEILFVLLPLSVVLILIALRVFSWAIRSGQFEDLDREALRILMDNRGDADADAPGEPGTPEAPATRTSRGKADAERADPDSELQAAAEARR